MVFAKILIRAKINGRIKDSTIVGKRITSLQKIYMYYQSEKCSQQWNEINR